MSVHRARGSGDWPAVRRGMTAGTAVWKSAGVLAAFAATLLGFAAGSPSRPAAPRHVEVLVPSLPASADPFRDTTVGASALFQAVYEPLLRGDESGRMVPILAEGWTNPEPTLVRFRLRRGVRFHDGAPLTAEDVRWSLRRAALSPAFASRLADVVEIGVTEPEVVAVRLRGERWGAVHEMGGIPIARESTRGFVGTGPFRLSSASGSEYVIERFPAYHGSAPYLRSARLRVASGPAEAATLARRAPFVVLGPEPALAGALVGAEYRLETFDTPSLFFLVLDTRAGPSPSTPGQPRNPLADRVVRRAMQLALDAQGLARAAGAWAAMPAGQMIPAGVIGHDRSLAAPRRDVALARRLLQSAGHGGGFGLVLHTGPVYAALAEEAAAQLAEAGIRVRVERTDSQRFRERVARGGAVHPWNYTVGQDPTSALLAFFHTPAASRGLGARNATGYSSRRLDDLLEGALQAAELEERVGRLGEATRLLATDLPAIPLFTPRTSRLVPRALAFPVRQDGLLILADGGPAS